MIENKIVCSDNIEYLKTLESEYIDMFLCSPPYDNLRDYNGYTLDLHGLGVEMFRTLKTGGVAVWVVQDACIKGTRTGSSFRTALDFMDIGFGLWETLIYQRRGVWNRKTRFRMDHEYIFVFSKGNKLTYFDKEHMKVPCKHPLKEYHGTTNIGKDGKRVKAGVIKSGEKKCNGTIFNYNFGGDGSKLKSKHPAVFPNLLALDFIECFCPKDGLVCDPYTAIPFEELSISEVHQEHGSIKVDNTNWFDKLPIGSLVRILPNHACLTCAAYSNYNILENGNIGDNWSRTNGW